MSRPCSQQGSFPRSTLHIGCFPSPVEPFRSLLWHVLVGFRVLQCTSWGFSQVLVLQYSHQTAHREHLPVISPSGHTQTWILENVQQLQLCNLQGMSACMESVQPWSPALVPCPGECSGKAGQNGSFCCFQQRFGYLPKTKVRNVGAPALGCV